MEGEVRLGLKTNLTSSVSSMAYICVCICVRAAHVYTLQQPILIFLFFSPPQKNCNLKNYYRSGMLLGLCLTEKEVRVRHVTSMLCNLLYTLQPLASIYSSSPN